MKKRQSGLLLRELVPVAAPCFHDVAGTEKGGEGTTDFPFHQRVDAGDEGEALAGTMTGGETTTVRGKKGATVILGQWGRDSDPADILEEKAERGKELGQIFARG
jgi:hypothetical protein